MLALEMSLLAREMRPTLSIDRAGHRVGEMATVLGWIVDCRNTDGLDLDHPAASEPRQNGIDLPRQLVALEVSRAFGVRASEVPAGHQASVLQEEDTIVDQTGIRNEIGEGRAGHAERFESYHGRLLSTVATARWSPCSRARRKCA